MVGSTARPRSADEIADLPEVPSIVAAADDRGVKAVVHFTRELNLTGILVGRRLVARSLLADSDLLEVVGEHNCDFRRDPAWSSYISMSVGRVNPHMFATSTRWHPDPSNPWVILEYSPEILGHGGAVFTSTNNAYPEVVRCEGLDGFNLMYSDTSRRWTSDPTRGQRTDDQPTDQQAEVLYPQDLGDAFLRSVVVNTGEAFDDVSTILEIGKVEGVDVRLDEEVFI